MLEKLIPQKMVGLHQKNGIFLKKKAFYETTK